jgi:hypothetical protein
VTYRIVRFYRDAWPNHRTIKRGLTHEQAVAHCTDPQTSSSTCTNAVGRARTRRLGPWFDGHERED